MSLRGLHERVRVFMSLCACPLYTGNHEIISGLTVVPSFLNTYFLLSEDIIIHMNAKIRVVLEHISVS